jgi:hypothetical protein
MRSCTWFVVAAALTVGLAGGAGSAAAESLGTTRGDADALFNAGVTAGGAMLLPGGVVEVASCAKGSKRAKIGGKVKCLKTGQACANRYLKAYRKYGFSCVGGHLRTAAPPPASQPPPPAPAPPPTPPAPTLHAQPGHYKGLTSQITDFEFDVTSDGNFVTHLVTGQINEGCTPEAHLYGGDLNFGTATIPIAADGSFTIDESYQGTVDEDPSTGHLTIVGHLSGSMATGTLSDTLSFTHDGTQYSCGSGLQTWTATRRG